jgi:hypothetical protein
MKIYESVISETLLQAFPIQGPSTLMSYAGNLVGLPETLSVAGLLWPCIVEDEGLFFLAQYYSSDNIAQEKEKYQRITQAEKQQLERVSNAMSLGQHFWSENTAVLKNEKLLYALGETLKFFWSMRLKTTFPDKSFIVELGENIAGEEGMVITFYQQWT